MKVVGQPIPRIDGQLKTTGRAMYAYEWHDTEHAVCLWVSLGRCNREGSSIKSIDITAAKTAPGVLAVVTALDVGERKKGKYNTAKLFGGDEVQHYHQAIAVVVAEGFEQAVLPTTLIKVEYVEEKGAFRSSSGNGNGCQARIERPPIRQRRRFRRRFQGSTGHL
jgi:xanthine dehydrogenase YagR molybdenum-binding subunit